MTMLEERFQMGLEILAQLGGGTPSSGSVPASREMAPDLYRITGEALFGSIWSRTGLNIRYREMCTLTILTVLQRERQLRLHIGNALNLGLTPEQVIEIFIHAAFYGGVPAAHTAIGMAKEVFDNRGISFTPQPVYDPSDDPDDLYQRGVERRRELLGDNASGLSGEPVTNAEREFRRLITEYYWGALWTRPGLDLQSRSICTLSTLTALGREGALRIHIRGALHIGLTQEQIIELFIHATFYSGFPFTLAAIEIANDIFRSE